MNSDLFVKETAKNYLNLGWEVNIIYLNKSGAPGTSQVKCLAILKFFFFFAVNLELMKNLWIPNIFIYNLKSFRTIDVLSKLAGLWIDAKKRIYYSQATHITFICKLHCHWCKLTEPEYWPFDKVSIYRFTGEFFTIF